MIITLAGLVLPAILVVLGVMALFRDRGARKDVQPDDAEAAYWDENCACCNAECGEADDENVCLICGH